MTATKLTKTEELSKESIAAAISDYCQRREVSQSELATQAGVSTAIISNMLNGRWDSISEAMWRKVRIVVSDDAAPAIVATADHQAMAQLCHKARKGRLMLGLIADTGMGKSTSLKAISRKRNTYYVVFDKTMRARQFFAAILREMGIPFEGSLYDMVGRIAGELNTQASPLLIVDEAGKLTHNVMLYMHVLRDKTAANAGIVLAGMPYFKYNLIKASNKQKEGCAEFFRRVNLWHELEGLTKAEIAFVCEQHGITDAEAIRANGSKKRFGDLMNTILLETINAAPYEH